MSRDTLGEPMLFYDSIGSVLRNRDETEKNMEACKTHFHISNPVLRTMEGMEESS